MSFNRLQYDNCAYNHQLHESVGTLAYILDPSRFENCNKCRMEFGTVGGTNVSHIKGNLVDLETDLRGTTRLASKCPTKKYINPCPNGDMTSCHPNQITIRKHPGNTYKDRVLDTSMEHLQPCQMIKYRDTPLEPAIPEVLCPQYNNMNEQFVNHKKNNNHSDLNCNLMNDYRKTNVKGYESKCYASV